MTIEAPRPEETHITIEDLMNPQKVRELANRGIIPFSPMRSRSNEMLFFLPPEGIQKGDIAEYLALGGGYVFFSPDKSIVRGGASTLATTPENFDAIYKLFKQTLSENPNQPEKGRELPDWMKFVMSVFRKLI